MNHFIEKARTTYEFINKSCRAVFKKKKDVTISPTTEDRRLPKIDFVSNFPDTPTQIAEENVTSNLNGIANSDDQVDRDLEITVGQPFPALRSMVNVGNPHKKFIKIRQLGKGAYGEVFKAINKSTGKQVAVKTCTVWPEDEEDYINEITAMKMNRHPNIVNYIESYLVKSELWIVMDYVAGGTLAHFAQKITMQEKHVAAVSKQVLKGIEHAHANNVIHRDIKGQNILLGLDGTVKIADFGVSAQIKPGRMRRNSLIGTPPFIAPEVVNRKPYNQKVDIWSFGMTLVQMDRRGKAPYNGLSVTEVLDRVGSHKLPRVSKWRKSANFLDFINRCLEKDEAKRPTATELLHHPFIDTAAPLEELSALAMKARIDESRLEFLDGVRMEGYLSKKTTSPLKSWKQRWFAIRSNQLVYRKMNGNKEVTVVMEPNLKVCTVRPYANKNGNICIEVITPTKSLHLEILTDSIESYRYWVQALNDEIAAINP